MLRRFPLAVGRAHADLSDLGVEVRTNALVTSLEPGTVWIGHERIAAGTVFWLRAMKRQRRQVV